MASQTLALANVTEGREVSRDKDREEGTGRKGQGRIRLRCSMKSDKVSLEQREEMNSREPLKND